MTRQKPTNNLIWNLILTLCLGVFLISCDQKPTAKAAPYELNQTIYFGGDIITMVGDEPEYVEAVVQREGYIVFTGTKAEAMERFQGKAEEVDPRPGDRVCVVMLTCSKQAHDYPVYKGKVS